MGKMKSFLIGCIDNKLDPVYTLDQVVKHRIKHEKEKATKAKESSSKGDYNQSFVQAQKGSKP